MPHLDPVARRNYHREYNRRHRDRYRPRDKAYSAARHANMKARRYGVTGEITADQAEQVLASGRCHYCGAKDVFWLGLDHVVPMPLGGPNLLSNIVAAFPSCNASKWQQDRPRHWSRRYDSCIGCGTASRPHLARGYCASCYNGPFRTERRHDRRAAIAGGDRRTDVARLALDSYQKV